MNHVFQPPFLEAATDRDCSRTLDLVSYCLAFPSKSEANSKVSVGSRNKKSAIRIGRVKPQPEFSQVIRTIAIKLTMEGADTQKVADDLGRSQTTIQTWINRFRAGGIDGLLTKNKGKRTTKPSTAERETALFTELAKGKRSTARNETGSAPSLISAR